MSGISLTAGIRANLLALQSVSDSLNETQARLATGKKVNSPIDNPDSFFTAYKLAIRAGELTIGLDTIAKGVKTLNVASAGIAAMKDLLTQAKGVAQGARALSTAATTDAERRSAAGEFNRLLAQSDTVAKDASFDGVNLLHNDSLMVEFGGKAGSSTSNLAGFDATSGGPVVTATAQTAANWTGDNTAIDNAIATIERSVANLETQSGVLRTNLGILTTRKTFTEDMVSCLNTGAADLTNADLRTETTAHLALASRQNFATNALLLASQNAQLVLRLLG